MKTLQQLHQRFLGLAMALAGVLVAGTLGYRLLEGWSLLDAVYMTVITITSVGFAEVHPLSTAGRVFTIGLIGCLQESFYDAESAARFLSGRILASSRKEILEARYDMQTGPDCAAGEVMETLAARRGFLLKGGAPDAIRACRILAADFSAGRIKGISLEQPAMPAGLQN